jgi:predicted transcriptional regulator
MDVDAPPAYEIVSEKTTDELVMAELAKHPQAVFMLTANLKIPHQTVDNAVRRLLMQGLVTRKPLTIRIDGRRRNVIEYRLVKK